MARTSQEQSFPVGRDQEDDAPVSQNSQLLRVQPMRAPKHYPITLPTPHSPLSPCGQPRHAPQACPRPPARREKDMRQGPPCTWQGPCVHPGEGPGHLQGCLALRKGQPRPALQLGPAEGRPLKSYIPLSRPTVHPPPCLLPSPTQRQHPHTSSPFSPLDPARPGRPYQDRAKVRTSQSMGRMHTGSQSCTQGCGVLSQRCLGMRS